MEDDLFEKIKIKLDVYENILLQFVVAGNIVVKFLNWQIKGKYSYKNKLKEDLFETWN